MVTSNITIPVAAILAFLYLLWKDSVRKSPGSRLMYAVRSMLIAAVTITLGMRPSLANATAAERTLTWIAIAVGTITTIVFVLRATGRLGRRKRDEEPLPSIFGPDGPPDGSGQPDQ